MIRTIAASTYIHTHNQYTRRKTEVFLHGVSVANTLSHPRATEVLTSQFIENEYEKGADRLLYLILSVLKDSFIGGCVFFVLWKRSTIESQKKHYY